MDRKKPKFHNIIQYPRFCSPRDCCLAGGGVPTNDNDLPSLSQLSNHNLHGNIWVLWAIAPPFPKAGSGTSINFRLRPSMTEDFPSQFSARFKHKCGLCQSLIVMKVQGMPGTIILVNLVTNSACPAIPRLFWPWQLREINRMMPLLHRDGGDPELVSQAELRVSEPKALEAVMNIYQTGWKHWDKKCMHLKCPRKNVGLNASLKTLTAQRVAASTKNQTRIILAQRPQRFHPMSNDARNCWELKDVKRRTKKKNE